jgi:ethanolaminephosphotransferase
MILIIYVITGIFGKITIFDKILDLTRITGPTFWDKKISTFTHLDRIPQVPQHVPNIGLNESFMVFGASGLAFNIFSRLRPSH